MTRRNVLSDDQCERIKDILQGRSSNIDVTAIDKILFVEAVLCHYSQGILESLQGDRPQIVY